MGKKKLKTLFGTYIETSRHHAKTSAKNMAKKLRRKGHKARVIEDKSATWNKWMVMKRRGR